VIGSVTSTAWKLPQLPKQGLHQGIVRAFPCACSISRGDAPHFDTSEEAAISGVGEQADCADFAGFDGCNAIESYRSDSNAVNLIPCLLAPLSSFYFPLRISAPIELRGWKGHTQGTLK